MHSATRHVTTDQQHVDHACSHLARGVGAGVGRAEAEIRPRRRLWRRLATTPSDLGQWSTCHSPSRDTTRRFCKTGMRAAPGHSHPLQRTPWALHRRGWTAPRRNPPFTASTTRPAATFGSRPSVRRQRHTEQPREKARRSVAACLRARPGGALAAHTQCVPARCKMRGLTRAV